MPTCRDPEGPSMADVISVKLTLISGGCVLGISEVLAPHQLLFAAGWLDASPCGSRVRPRLLFEQLGAGLLGHLACLGGGSPAEDLSPGLLNLSEPAEAEDDGREEEPVAEELPEAIEEVAEEAEQVEGVGADSSEMMEEAGGV